MFNKLYVRFGLIIALVMVSWAIVQFFPFNKGIDLGGGVDLVYELDLSKKTGADVTTLTNQVVETLKRRIDPQGVKNITWRVIGGNRIEIQMPLASAETRAARTAFNATLDRLTSSNLHMSDLNSALSETGETRKAALDKLAAPGTQRRDLLEKLAAAWDARETSDAAAEKALAEGKDVPVELVAARAANRAKFNEARDAVLAKNIDARQITDLLQATDEGGAKAREELNKFITAHADKKAELDSVVAAYDVLRQHRGGGIDDPAELKRQLRGAGVLDFRIAVTPGDPGMMPTIQQAIEQIRTVGPHRVNIPRVRWFQVDPKNGTDLEKQDYRLSGDRGGVVVEQSAGMNWILLYTDPMLALTHGGAREDWGLSSANVGHDDTGARVAVHFTFDPTGAAYFGQLTGANVHRPMAILVDDMAISAPNINSAITAGSGMITFGSGNRGAASVIQEAETLVRMLKAGSLPATLQPDPISEVNIGSSFGENNINAGIQSSVIAVIAVMLFMMIYYTLTGMFANVALLINLLMTMAIMNLMGATWTLPGIAGLVLTLGMAVDANVLINERIREEVHRGSSLWMAVRMGYDKVFWTIFDANLTTALTSVVLIFIDKVGGVFLKNGGGGAAQEVKGFGVTLLIGLTVSMFTALFVTRTLMIASVKWGILRKIDDRSLAEYIKDVVTFSWLRQGTWPFMRVITVSNFDWIGKRHIFWTISAAVTVAGMVAFFARGEEKYDTEFNGGTQVTLQLREDAPLSQGEVSDRIEKLAKEFSDYRNPQDKAQQSKFNDMGRALAGGQAQVQEVKQKNLPPHTRYQIVTTIADRKLDDKTTLKVKNDFLEGLKRVFARELDVTPELRFEHPAKTDMDALMDAGVVRPITGRLLSDMYPKAPKMDLSDVAGGVAIEMRNIDPPQPLSRLEKRLKEAQVTSPRGAVHYWTLQVVPLPPEGGAGTLPAEAAAGTAPATAAGAATQENDPLVSRAVVLTADPQIPYSRDALDAWKKDVAGAAWEVVQAGAQSSSLAGVNSFDPTVAEAAKTQAMIAIIISLALIIVYVWIRFGSIRYGVGAILSLMHDAVVAVAATVLSGVLVKHLPGVAAALHVSDFKINLTMIAAYLTVVGYSVNDTIVIFDRIRENRGRLKLPLTAKLVNDSINQCFGRTIWTTFTVFIVVAILYIWGGEGVRGFAFAMLAGVITGAYSTLAIASPALLSMAERKHSREEMQAKEPAGELGSSGLAPRK